MIHKMRWTAEKIAQRLRVIEPLVYRRSEFLPPLRYKVLAGPMDPPPLDLDADLADWPVLQPHGFQVHARYPMSCASAQVTSRCM